MPATAVIEDIKQKMIKAVDHVLHDFSTIHTGKASPTMVEGIMVDVETYGSRMKIKEMAAVMTPDSRSIVIQPWDKAVSKFIVKAIQTANIGINPIPDGAVIRCPVPELSGERREQLFKVCKEMAEAGRTQVRNLRRDALTRLKEDQKAGALSEDDLKRLEKDVQQLTDKYVAEIGTHLDHKEKELKSV